MLRRTAPPRRRRRVLEPAEHHNEALHALMAGEPHFDRIVEAGLRRAEGDL
jgi:hypothetical protein